MLSRYKTVVNQRNDHPLAVERANDTLLHTLRDDEIIPVGTQMIQTPKRDSPAGEGVLSAKHAVEVVCVPACNKGWTGVARSLVRIVPLLDPSDQIGYIVESRREPLIRAIFLNIFHSSKNEFLHYIPANVILHQTIAGTCTHSLMPSGLRSFVESARS